MEQRDSINDFFEPFRKYLSRGHNFHYETKYRNTEKGVVDVKFGFGDTEELYKKNLELYPDLLSTYVEKPLSYSINSHGCRSNEEFIPDISREVDIYLGCSFTFGVGHYWDNTWPFYVGKFQGRDIINLGIPGGSMESSFHILAQMINFYLVRNVFHYQPVYPRYSFPAKVFKTKAKTHTREVLENFLPGTLDDKLWTELYGEYVPWNRQGLLNQTEEDYIMYNHFKYVNAIRGLCSSPFTAKLGFPKYYHIHGTEFNKEDLILFKDYQWRDNPDRTEIHYFDHGNNLVARDLGHYTVKQNVTIANRFISLMKTHPEGYTGFDNFGIIQPSEFTKSK